MPKSSHIHTTFPDSIYSLWDAIGEIAVNHGDWDSYGIEQRNFLENASSPQFRNGFYHTFSIPKKNGGKRTITAPTGLLKDAQKAISILLDIVYSAPYSVNGFASERNVRTNAIIHTGKNYVYNTDLRDFFPGITDYMVRKALTYNGVNDDVACYISKVCTVTSSSDDLPDDVLAQGSPASPILSNLVCLRMDRRLEFLSGKYGLNYSRYADDITFSSIYDAYSPCGDFIRELREAIRENGFAINENKTRLQKKGSRQEVTGLVVNEKTNVSRKYLKNLRAEVFHMEMFGYTKAQYRSVLGKIAFVRMVRGREDKACKLLRNRVSSIKLTPDGLLTDER